MRRLLPLVCPVLLLAGCALLSPSAPPPRVVSTQTSERFEQQVTVLDEPFDTVHLTRAQGLVRLQVTSQRLCRVEVYRAIDQGYSNGRVERGTPKLLREKREPCAGPAQPGAALDVGLQAGPRLYVLGTTSQAGELEVSYASLDARFPAQSLPLSLLAQVLVHGKQVAELPLGLIVNRMQLSADTVAAADATLNDPGASREQLRSRLAELWSLAMQGVEDPRLHERALRVYVRLKAYAPPQQPTTSPAPVADSDAGDFLRAESLLPGVCKATVAGGETILGMLALAGPAGFLWEFTTNLLDLEYAQYLAQECCVWAAGMLPNAKGTDCQTLVKPS